MTEAKVFTVEVNSKGQFIIPEEIREELGIADKINMDLDGDKVILSKPDFAS